MSVSIQRPAAGKINDIAAAIASVRPWFVGVGLFSVVINILMLTGSLYMLQLYDRVMASRSLPTLVALSMIALGAFAVQGLLDIIRARMLVRIGARFDELVAPPAFETVSKLSLAGLPTSQAMQPVRDVENVRGFLSGLGPTALFDMPFMPLFLLGCALLHPGLGLLALGGGIVIIALTLAVEAMTRARSKDVQAQGHDRQLVVESARRNAEVIAAMGFRAELTRRFVAVNTGYVRGAVNIAEIAGTFASLAKIFRMLLQSAILGLGTYYVILQEMSAGGIIAASIMAARALAPIEIAIAHWRGFLAARQSYARLTLVLKETAAPQPLGLPPPRHRLEAEGLVVAGPGQREPIINGVSLRLQSGTALGIVGPSGSGKSTLARALVGVWKPLAGHVRLDGAGFDQWSEVERGRHVGYLPQDVELFDGTVAENIARFDPEATSDAVVAAATAAGAHDMIVHLKQGYDTPIGEAGVKLSGGQRQRLALARALYGEPFLVVLDEPNSNLDQAGEQALTEAIRGIRKRGGIAVIITHRPAAIVALDLVAIMKAGTIEQIATKEELARKAIQVADAPARQRRPQEAPLAAVASAETVA